MPTGSSHQAGPRLAARWPAIGREAGRAGAAFLISSMANIDNLQWSGVTIVTQEVQLQRGRWHNLSY